MITYVYKAMNERFIPQNPNGPHDKAELFDDTDPFRETLTQIHDRYQRLAMRDPNTSYSRNLSVETNEPGSSIDIRLVTSGGVDNTSASTMSVFFPNDKVSVDGVRGYSNFNAANLNGTIMGGMDDRIRESDDPFREIDRWRTDAGQPAAITEIFRKIEEIHLRHGDDDGLMDMDATEYSDLWQAAQTALKSSSPTPTICSWRPSEMTTLVTFAGEHVYSIDSTHTLDGNEMQLQQAGLQTEDYDFSVQANDDGALIYNYTDLRKKKKCDFTLDKAKQVLKTLDDLLTGIDLNTSAIPH
jgi:hypothetical protein